MKFHDLHLFLDIEHMKHQLTALRVLRPKIVPAKRTEDALNSGEAEEVAPVEQEMGSEEEGIEGSAEGEEGEDEDAE